MTSRAAAYAYHSIRITLHQVPFVVFTIALPVGMYLLFSMMFGDMGEGAARAGIMVNMAAYGGLGAAVTAGAQIQEDLRTGFLRQLMVAGLTPRGFLIGSLAAASAIVLPALVAVFLTGAVTGVDATPGRMIAAIGVLWAGLLPAILIGLVLGMFLRGSAASAGSVVVMMLMAIAGGLWMPLEMFPGWMQSLGQGLPTFWMSRWGAWALGGPQAPAIGLLVVGIWVAALALTVLLGMRRSRGGSRR
ncbi:ABC transporter permease [Brachybacterium phenoliresistens]|uniref:ABC transporter n=1 Tax=Brachybacterium phenoliresistens TaxID=396014 RepID=Z9JPA0_9MICO|nr:ABC transporter permease [Brachybacterium phenoliresistens]EWS79611.1 ABC transporter [Brachybacterium phenoliresistens]